MQVLVLADAVAVAQRRSKNQSPATFVAAFTVRSPVSWIPVLEVRAGVDLRPAVAAAPDRTRPQ